MKYILMTGMGRTMTIAEELLQHATAYRQNKLFSLEKKTDELLEHSSANIELK